MAVLEMKKNLEGLGLEAKLILENGIVMEGNAFGHKSSREVVLIHVCKDTKNY